MSRSLRFVAACACLAFTLGRTAAEPSTEPAASAAHRTATNSANASPEGFALPRLPLEVSASVTAVYGTSKRGDFYGGGVSTTVFDPNHGWSVTLGISTLRGTLPYYRSDYRSRYGVHGGSACW